jgi:hypothetical protein
MWSIVELFRRRKAARQLQQYKLENPYRMLPTDDGGESYRMECTFCREEGNIMSQLPFQHKAQCPAGKLEAAQFAAMRKKK